jgi:hypothetical protein
MKLPWISLRSHNAIVVLLSTQLGELKDERKLLLDRLATLGLGGPIFRVPPPKEEAEAEETPELADPEGEAIAELMRFRRRPAKLADELTRKAYRDYSKRDVGPRVAWVPASQEKVNAALDEAEAQGKRMNGN